MPLIYFPVSQAAPLSTRVYSFQEGGMKPGQAETGSVTGSTGRGWRATRLDPELKPVKSSVFSRNRELDLNSDNSSSNKSRDKSKDSYTSRVIQSSCVTCVFCWCTCMRVCFRDSKSKGSFRFFSPLLPHFRTSTPQRELRIEAALISLFLRSSRSSTARWSKVSPLCGFRLW